MFGDIHILYTSYTKLLRKYTGNITIPEYDLAKAPNKGSVAWYDNQTTRDHLSALNSLALEWTHLAHILAVMK